MPTLFRYTLSALAVLLACPKTHAISKNVSVMKLKAGDQAPSFVGVDQRGRTVRLEDFRGGKLVLYFYPKDNTPFCTAQAKSLRDRYDQLRQAGYSVVGVSTDDVASHKAFAEKHNIPFPLLADTDHSVHQLYGTWIQQKVLWLWKFWGSARTTFVIDEEGRIAKIIDQVQTKTHADQILSHSSDAASR